MKISILTICPESFVDFGQFHVIKRARELGLLDLEIIDIRDYAGGSFRHIDDSPYGGGNGMILRCGPVLDAARAAAESEPDLRTCTIALAPIGTPYSQAIARRLAQEEHLILICGHYEGMDARIYNHTDEILSIGDYVLSGGELPAMVVADSVARLLPGNLKEGSAAEESFEGEDGLLEYPQYTRPADYNGEKVPEILLSGNHEAVRAWRKEQALLLTKERRPDLLPRD